MDAPRDNSLTARVSHEPPQALNPVGRELPPQGPVAHHRQAITRDAAQRHIRFMSETATAEMEAAPASGARPSAMQLPTHKRLP